MSERSDFKTPPVDDELVERILAAGETLTLETKRVGRNDRKIETVIAFANTEGGILALGIEDPAKASGRDRLRGIQENPESVDDLKRLLAQRITPRLTPPDTLEPVFVEIGCTLRDGKIGSIVLVRVAKSGAVHSLVDDGTFIRLPKSNRQIPASEITELAFKRGTVSVVSGLVDVPFDLLDGEMWREYASQRQLSRPIPEAMLSLGLARKEGKAVKPTRAAVLLFAEEPGGLLDSKCAVRLFHYRGDNVEHSPSTNLLRPPRTISGPLLRVITETTRVIVDELATGVQVGPLGFEVAQKYPVRVIQEAVTNAVIHRDYRLSADIHVRIFSDRIEVESPGLLPGPVSIGNLREIGSRPRNRVLVDHLREFPRPPNLDAGEGVRMMFRTMNQASLYPPVFLTEPELKREAVRVFLFNEARPSTWDQVADFIQRHGVIGNREVRELLRSDDPVRASRLLRAWVTRGLLVVVDPSSAKQLRRYRLAGGSVQEGLFSSLPGNEPRDDV